MFGKEIQLFPNVLKKLILFEGHYNLKSMYNFLVGRNLFMGAMCVNTAHADKNNGRVFALRSNTNKKEK